MKSYLCIMLRLHADARVRPHCKWCEWTPLIWKQWLYCYSHNWNQTRRERERNVAKEYFSSLIVFSALRNLFSFTFDFEILANKESFCVDWCWNSWITRINFGISIGLTLYLEWPWKLLLLYVIDTSISCLFVVVVFCFFKFNSSHNNNIT